jgi:hypothetical protein
MSSMRQAVTIAFVLLLTSALLPPISASSDEERAKQLQKERARLEKETDPLDRVKISIRISEILLEDVGESVRVGDFDQMERELTEYSTTIQDAHQALANSGRDASKRPGGFKELEIALRKHIRKFEDVSRALTLEHRDPVDKTRDLASGIRDKLLKALFP